MIITRKAMGRRTMLRGMGAVLALPLLDAMSSSARAAEEAAAARKRLQVIYTPNGMMMQNFTPAAAGRGLCHYARSSSRWSPTATSSWSSPAWRQCRPKRWATARGDHGRCCGSYLTGVHVKKTEGADITSGVSMDQLVAKQFGEQDPDSLAGTGPGTAQPGGKLRHRLQLRLYQHLVLARRHHAAAGHHQSARSVRAAVRRRRQPGCQEPPGAAEAPGQRSWISWRTTPSACPARWAPPTSRRWTNICSRCATSSGASRRWNRAAQAVALPAYARPSGIPDCFRGLCPHDDRSAGSGHAGRPDPGRQLDDRAAKVSGRSYPEIGVPDAHHPLSHHGNDPEKIAKLTKINTLHMEQVAYYLKRMSETKEGDGTLLDNTMLLAGASLADPNRHDHANLPMIVAGGLVKGNRHVAVGQGHAHDQPDAVDDGHAGRAAGQAGRQHRPAFRTSRLSRARGDEKELRTRLSAVWAAFPALPAASVREDRLAQAVRGDDHAAIKSLLARACQCQRAAAGQVHRAGLGGGSPGRRNGVICCWRRAPSPTSPTSTAPRL